MMMFVTIGTTKMAILLNLKTKVVLVLRVVTHPKLNVHLIMLLRIFLLVIMVVTSDTLKFQTKLI